MLGSRRIDGMFMRLWFSYVDENGRLLNPFPLPQRGMGLWDTRLRSYNVTEFIKGPVKILPGKLVKTIRRNEF